MTITMATTTTTAIQMTSMGGGGITVPQAKSPLGQAAAVQSQERVASSVRGRGGESQ